jgi:lipid-binding SYLF domain-containing protein
MAAPADPPAEKETARVEAAARVLDEMLSQADFDIPAGLVEKSAALAVIPDVIKAALFIGGRHGRGVVVRRNADGSWGPPCFITITGGSAGWQVGVESADVLLVFRTGRGVENLARGKFTLGADAGIAVGPQGRQAEASTDTEFKAEIYSYSRSRGLYVGLSLQGASLRIDKEANENFYGVKGVKAEDILAGRVPSIPPAVAKLRAQLVRFVKSGRR